MNKMRRLLLAATAAMPFARIQSAFAQSFSSKPIRIIVPTSAGTSTDALARFFTEPLAQRLKCPVLVENKPGAGGLLGYTSVLKATADGYTILASGLPLHLLPLNPETTVKFDPVKDFTPIARVAKTPLAFVVPASSAYRNLADLIKAMRTNPDGLTYSSQGIGSSGHLCGALLRETSKGEARHVAYKETSLAVTDVASKFVDFTCQGSVSVLSLIRAGKLRALAVTSPERWQVLPQVPTVVEEGLSALLFNPGIQFIGPAGMPQTIVEILSDAITTVAVTPAYREFLAGAAISHEVLGAKTLAEQIPKDVERWKHINALARNS